MSSQSSIIIMIILFSLPLASLNASNALSKISELRLYADDKDVLAMADGMMNEVVVTAEYPNATLPTNRTFNFKKVSDVLTLIANLMIIVFFVSFVIVTLLSKWKEKKNRKSKKGPFSLPPFSTHNKEIGKDYAC